MDVGLCVCFFKQKAAYEIRISDWSSDVCSSDLQVRRENLARAPGRGDEIHAQVRLALAHVQARKRLAATKRRQEAMLQRRQRVVRIGTQVRDRKSGV